MIEVDEMYLQYPGEWKFDGVGFEIPLEADAEFFELIKTCLLYTSPSPRDATLSRMPSSA